MKLVAAIIAALFVMELKAELVSYGPPAKGRPQRISVAEICFDLKFAMSRLSPDKTADAEKTFAAATNVFIRFETKWGEKGERLETALDTVVHRRSNCSESSLQIVKTIADCELWRSNAMKSLDDANKEYALKCLTPDYITQRVNSSLSSFGASDVTRFLDHQFFVDYKSEFPEGKTISYGSLDEEKSTKALAKAIIRDRERDIITTEEDVYLYLEDRLFWPCSSFTEAFNELLTPLMRVAAYLEGYEKLISSLDEKIRQQFTRYQLCRKVSDEQIRKYVSRKVSQQFQLASA